MKKLVILLMAIAVATTSFDAATAASQGQTQPHQKTEACYFMKDGKMYYSVNGTETLMKKDVTLKNGTEVMTNGTWKVKGKKAELLKNDECIDTRGIIHPSHEAHHKKA